MSGITICVVVSLLLGCRGNSSCNVVVGGMALDLGEGDGLSRLDLDTMLKDSRGHRRL